MFESKTERLLPRPAFYARLARSFLIALVIVAFSLGALVTTFRETFRG